MHKFNHDFSCILAIFAVSLFTREWIEILKFNSRRLHHACTSILIQFRGAFLCPKASETAWISKSNRSLERVQKQKNRLRFPSESVFCLRKRFFVGKNAPKIF